MPNITKPNAARMLPTRWRQRLFSSIFAGFMLAGPLASSNLRADESRLTVSLQGIRGDTGNLRVSLYREPETFRKEEKAVKVISIPAAKGDTSVIFDALPPGRYAIMAYHDENSDNKLNLRFGMFPTEGYGLSNNPNVVGPPKFAESAFDVAGPETSASIKLFY